ncbi:MAG TPA: phytoene/squalene synthase family protein [Planctomycetota bacterium]|nr:phytoene/squalene synthase family protein [Planctomycetota bacterium]
MSDPDDQSVEPEQAQHGREYLLGELLKNVSRSFYLTLRVLPRGLRAPIGLGYLLARAADTIADTQLVLPAQRLEHLLSFRAQVNDGIDETSLARIQAAFSGHQSDSHERKLLNLLRPSLALLDTLSPADRAEVQRVVTTLTRGMEMDLRTFPLETSGQIVALKTREELDLYIYLVAGCVGEFWTKMTVAHSPELHGWDVDAMSRTGIRFGKALQMTNVLRDCAKDLRIGRCYLPLELLTPAGVAPEDLLKPENAARAQPVLRTLLGVALDHFAAAEDYILAIPPRCGRLRLACLWPVLIGLATLQKLAANPDWLNPDRPSKVSRSSVKRTLALSLPAVGSDTLVRMWIDHLMKSVRAEIAA